MSRGSVTSGVRQSDLARAWGVSRQTVSRYAKEGMPLDSIEAAAAWRLAVKGTGEIVERMGPGLNCSAAEKNAPGEMYNDSLRGLVERARETERLVWKDLQVALEKNSGHEIRVHLLRQHKEAAATRLKVEVEAMELDVRLGRLVEMESAKKFIRGALAPLLVAMRAMPAKVAVKANPARPEISQKAVAEEIQRVLGSVQENLK